MYGSWAIACAAVVLVFVCVYFFVALRKSVIHTRMGYGQLPPTPDGHKVMDHPTYNNARPRTNMIRARYDHGTTTFVANALPCTSPQSWHNRGIATLIGPERGTLRTRKRLWHGTVFRLHAGRGAVKASNEYRSILERLFHCIGCNAVTCSLLQLPWMRRPCTTASVTDAAGAAVSTRPGRKIAGVYLQCGGACMCLRALHLRE